MSNNNLVSVPFHGDTILTIETEDGLFVPIKPICELFGISRQGQQQKISADAQRWGGKIILLPSAGGEQETFCLPISRLAAWLFTISPNKVKPEVRDGLIRYQTEAADVLDRHFRLRERDRDAKLHTELALLRRFNRNLTTQLLVTKPAWNKVMRLHEAGYGWNSIRVQIGKGLSDWSVMEEAMEDCGLLPPPPGAPTRQVDRALREAEG